MGTRGRVLLVVVAVLAALVPATAAAAAPPPPNEVDPDSLLVRLRHGDQAALDERGLRQWRAVGRSGYLEVDVPGARLEAMRRSLAGDRRVESVGYNHIFKAFAAPNDERLAAQSGLARVRAPQAWEEQAEPGPGFGQVIAIVDSGVDLDHPDLENRLLPGFDFVDTDAEPDDENGHGTLVAGVAAAEANNAIGIAGVAHAAQILPVRVLDDMALGTEADIVEGIDFATIAGAKVINLSLGSLHNSAPMQGAVERAIAAGAVVVAASGNFGAPVPAYPAAYPGVLAVGATDDPGAVTWFSEYGSWLGIVAPGVNVLSTERGGGYRTATGTSFSAPFASGAAAMVRTGNPSMTVAQVVARLRDTAQDASHAGPDPYYGAGVLDVYAALVPAEEQSPLAIAPGDQHEAGEPTMLILSSAGTASLNTATISPEGDVDSFAFDVPGNGSVAIVVTPSDSPFAYQQLDPIVVAGREGGAMTVVDELGPRGSEILVLDSVSTGRYVAQVANYNPSRTSAYALSVFYFPPESQAASTTTTTSTPEAPKTPPPPPPRSGYWMLDSGGRVYTFGDAGWFGDGGPRAVDIEPTPSGDGYWIVDQHSSMYARGDAPYLGGARLLESGEIVTSISRTATGQGVWLFTNRGRVLTYGDARHFGDMSGTALNGPVLDSIPTPSGNGYFMVASDGGVFAFGDAVFAGSMGGTRLNQPVQSLVPDADNRGYWLVASDGGIFAFDAGFFGSMGDTPLNQPVTGMVRSGTGNGYLMVAEDGGIFAFGDARFHGSLGDSPPTSPITSVAYLSD